MQKYVFDNIQEVSNYHISQAKYRRLQKNLDRDHYDQFV